MNNPFSKPWYRYRPQQLFARMVHSCRASPAEVIVGVAWGGEFHLSPRETIGRSIWHTGIYDLTVSEALWRLTPVGGFTIDVGANLGYTSVLLGKRVVSTGQVVAYEPNAAIYDRLHKNLRQNGVTDWVKVRKCALSVQPGVGKFAVPAGGEVNDGLGKIVCDDESADSTVVALSSIDHDYPGQQVDVLKIDVEGHEAEVIRGGESSLKTGRIRNIVFEEHDGPTSEPCRLLQSFGYEILQLGWTLSGPLVASLTDKPICKPYEPPSYLATRELDATMNAFRQPGWQTLRPPCKA